MAETIIDELEERYAVMGEYLLGSVRPFSERSWHWRDENRTYLYARDTLSDLRLLQVLSPTEEGGVTGKRFFFNGQGTLLKVLGVTLSGAEYHQEGFQEYLLKLHRLEDALGMEPPITEDDEKALWNALFLPVDELD